jgi:hypothetical protein
LAFYAFVDQLLSGEPPSSSCDEKLFLRSRGRVWRDGAFAQEPLFPIEAAFLGIAADISWSHGDLAVVRSSTAAGALRLQ